VPSLHGSTICPRDVVAPAQARRSRLYALVLRRETIGSAPPASNIPADVGAQGEDGAFGKGNLCPNL
jgi:hypothetical protein